MVIGIIGGGASGMAAALAASENKKNSVILLERQTRLGRKLLATGNGRCNLTNMHVPDRTVRTDGTGSVPANYHGDHPEFAEYALSRYSPEETRSWFRRLGLLTVAEESGRVYPWSDQANSVLDVLRYSLERDNIEIRTGFEAAKIRRIGRGFAVSNTDETVECERLIIACGGIAGTKLGGSIAGYKLLKAMGHSSTRLRPALVQVKTDWPESASLRGVRAVCRASILHNGAETAFSRGEVQFTEYGLSGPVIFEISRDVCTQPGDWECELDLLPDLTENDLAEELRIRCSGSRLNASELFVGLLHNRLGQVLVRTAGIDMHTRAAALGSTELHAAAHAAKALTVKIKEPLGMDAAQVTAGGICTDEFDERTMESKSVPGLYVCGELLDIDGDCGGFNLQWAWSSGRLAGSAASDISKG